MFSIRIAIFPLLFSISLHGQVLFTPGIDTSAIHDLISQPSLAISNIIINCDNSAYGEFKGQSELPITHGLFLSTGKGSDAFSRNDSENETMVFGTQDTISGFLPRYDVCAIEFDVRSTDSVISFLFSFGSEEYPEYVNSGFNDVFAILVSGRRPNTWFNYVNMNIAFLPDSSSTCINHVNTNMNMTSFYDNTFPRGTFMEYDGLTAYLRASVNVVPDSLYHIIFVIGDQDDPYFDSGGFIAAEDSDNRPLPVMPASGVDCYPNPVTDELVWLPTQGLSIVSARLYDDIGRLVYEVADPMEQRTIDMRHYAPGMYILQVEGAYFHFTFKVIKA